MFNDIGALELVTIVVLAILVFGPDKLPKVIQDVSGFIRKIRAFSDNAKQDIRSELGPEFKDFEFEDLNPKTFIRKQLTENEDLRELRGSFDLRKELNEVTDAVNGRESDLPRAGAAPSATPAAGTGPDLLKKPAAPAQEPRTPFDADAT
ncbi:Sec-independent protein translocase subunit TatB [Streptomyces sp. WAC07061]|uniref:sec-independent translocase n=1 Tax=Streptomyces sp. WAC07061 TaxID=2487410 RepID=UPI000F776849|nr:sec-independent translocase [Streptomyces sp. WAC07061]RSS49256.1 Sec-independent protein translocase subunit TatB [Streptomyces sp. WAC07061]